LYINSIWYRPTLYAAIQCTDQERTAVLVNGIIILIMALQLVVQSFGLLNQFLPSSSILDKGLLIWHF
jgi:hypothetical protein